MKRRSKTTRLMGLLFILLLGSTLMEVRVFAQMTYGSLTGQVTDPTGAAVAGAQVTLTDIDTGYQQITKTDDAGIYLIKTVSAGHYTLKISALNFADYVQTGIVIAAQQYATQNVKLEIAKAGATVTVTAGTELIDTTTAELGMTINEQSTVDLPLNGRDPSTLALLAPGMQDGNRVGVAWSQPGFSFPGESVASSNGGRVGSTFYMLDGVTNMDTYLAEDSPAPDPDATQQFRLISDNFSAVYGFSPGGVVSMSTRSGTNQWHGGLFEFMRNGDFDARNWQYHERDTYRQNQYGGSVGGPVLKNRLFAFANYQGTVVAGGPGNETNSTTTPTQQMMNGDFSGVVTYDQANNPGTCGAPGTQVPANKLLQCGVMNGPFTTTVSDGVYTYNQLIGGAAALDSAAVAFTNDGLPGHTAPATSTAPPTIGVQNVAGNILYASAADASQHYNQNTDRIDYDLTSKQRLTLRSFVDKYTNPGGDIPGDVLSVLNLNNWSFNFAENMWYFNELLQHTWTVSPNLVNTASGYWTSQASHNGKQVLDKNGKPMCWSRYVGVTEPACYMEGAGIGGANGGWTEAENEVRQTEGLSDTLIYTVHRHTLSAGIDIMKMRAAETGTYPSAALISLNGGYTNPNNEEADWLLGYMSSFTQGAGELSDVQGWEINPYATDEWRIKPNLTLTLGLRWDPDLPPVQVGGRGAAFVPGQQSAVFPAAPTGLIFPGDNGMQYGLRPTNKRIFEPRVGVAWQPKNLPRTAFHAAFGMFSAPVAYSAYNHVVDIAPFAPTFSPGVPSQTPICYNSGSTTSTTCAPNTGQTVAGYMNFDNPWTTSSFPPGGNPFTPVGKIPWATPSYKPPYNSPIPGPVGIGASWGRNFRSPMTQAWNVSVEQQLSNVMAVRLAYVGSESYHQTGIFDPNDSAYSYCTAYNNPNCALPTQANLNNGTLKYPVLPYPNFTAIDEYDSPGTASYHALQATVQRTMAHGLQAQSSFTWSKSIDTSTWGNLSGSGGNDGSQNSGLDNPRDLAWSRGISMANIPFAWVTNFVARSPDFKGQSLLVREALGGWELSSIMTWQSGTAFSIGSGNSQSVYGELGLGSGCLNGNCQSDRADRVPGVPLKIRQGGRANWTKQYFNPAAFTTRHDGTYGTSARNMIQGPPGFNTDAAMIKNISFWERYQLQVRFEFFNVFNHPIMENPDTNPFDSDPNSGTINGPGGYGGLGGPGNQVRIGQAALKLTF